MSIFIRAGWFWIGVVFFLGSTSFAEEIYTWTDESGTIHFTDSLQKIPPESRNQVETKSMGKKPPSSKPNSEGEEGDPHRPAPNLSIDAPVSPSHPQALERHEVPFQPYEGTARRVIVEVTFNGAITAPMAIDTGAPGMTIKPELAEKLGIFENDQGKLIVQAGGIGGRVPAIRTIVDRIQIGGAKGHFIPTTVTRLNTEAFEGLIGMDFLSNYSMKVDWKKKVVIFEEIPLDPEMPGGRDEQWWRALYGEFGSMRLQWQEYERFINDRLESSLITTGGDIELMKKLKGFSAIQVQEADKLLSKLDRYANQHFVPRHWRQY